MFFLSSQLLKLAAKWLSVHHDTDFSDCIIWNTYKTGNMIRAYNQPVRTWIWKPWASLDLDSRAHAGICEEPQVMFPVVLQGIQIVAMPAAFHLFTIRLLTTVMPGMD